MTDDAIDVIRRYVETYNDRTLPDAAEEHFDSDVALINEAAGVDVVGIEAYLDHTYNGWIAAVPDAAVDLRDYDVGDGTMTCTLAATGTFTGTLETTEGTMPGTGKPFEIDFVVEATLDGDRITRWESTYDVEDWQRQVGLAEVA